jgi:hypothetical protein
MAEVRYIKRVKPNPMSNRKRAEIAARNILRLQLLKERGPWCQAHTTVCRGAWIEMHELLARSQGGDPLDHDNILCICRACHEWIHRYPKQALELGLRHSRQCQPSPK